MFCLACFLWLCRLFLCFVVFCLGLSGAQPSVDACIPSLTQGREPANVLSDLYRSGVFLLENSVRSSTRKTYSVGVRAWFSFCETIAADPFLREEPALWYTVKSLFGFREGIMMAFISNLYFDVGLRPTTISIYLSSVRFFLKTSGIDVSFLNSPGVSGARTGMCVLYRGNNPVAGERTLPITVDFILFAIGLFGQFSAPQNYVLVVAMVLAFTCLLRSCEYVGKYKLLGQDVTFEFLPPASGQIVFVSASDYRTLSSMARSSLCGVVIHNAAAKNDPSGEGYRFHYARQRFSGRAAFDIVEILFDWAVAARLRPSDPFLSYRQCWALSYSRFNTAIKFVATSMKLDASRYSTHSLRIGGASVLAAAGLPDYFIQVIGRWKSLAFLSYIRSASSMFNKALSALTNPSLLTVSHLFAMNPASTRPRP